MFNPNDLDELECSLPSISNWADVCIRAKFLCSKGRGSEAQIYFWRALCFKLYVRSAQHQATLPFKEMSAAAEAWFLSACAIRDQARDAEVGDYCRQATRAFAYLGAYTSAVEALEGVTDYAGSLKHCLQKQLFCLVPEKEKETKNVQKPSASQRCTLWEKRNDLTHIFRSRKPGAVNEFPIEQLFSTGLRYRKHISLGFSINTISYEEITRKLSLCIGKSIKILEQDPAHPHICRCGPVGRAG